MHLRYGGIDLYACFSLKIEKPTLHSVRKELGNSLLRSVFIVCNSFPLWLIVWIPIDWFHIRLI